MSTSLGRCLTLVSGAVLVVAGALLVATEVAVGIGAATIVLGLAALSYRFGAGAEADDRSASPSFTSPRPWS